METERVHHDEYPSSMSSSFLIIPTSHAGNVADDGIEITTIYSKNPMGSYADVIGTVRDTSDVSIDFELDNTRDSASSIQQITVVNTHDSILDLESQCGDGDETSLGDDNDDMDMLMGIINECSSNEENRREDEKPKARPVSPNHPRETEDVRECVDEKDEDTGSIMGGLTLYSVTDSFVDSICTSTACVVSEKYTNYKNYNKITKRKDNKTALVAMEDKMNEFQESCQSAAFNSCAEDKREEPQQIETSPESNKAIVSMDIWQLLGCSSPPGSSELDDIWSLRTTSEMLKNGEKLKSNGDSKLPARASIRKRLKRIHRLRMDDRRVSGASRHGVTITNHCLDSSERSLNNIRNDIHMIKSNTGKKNNPDYSFNNDEGCENGGRKTRVQPSYRSIDKSYSMDDDPLGDFIGQGMIDPIPIEIEDEDGYDSDPEINCYSVTCSIVTDSPTHSQVEQLEESSSSSALSASNLPHAPPLDSSSALSNDHRDVLRVNPIPTDEREMKESVQQTLNSTWTLTWHTNAENRKDYNISHTKPICVNMWLERGTVITNSGVVIEPAFMWRDAYQPLLLSQHKLNTSTQKPWSMRLLNACRITPYSSASDNKSHGIDREKYPFARQNASFLLKSCGGEEFLLEAGSFEDAIAITERWKLVVARFACLAVTEDVGGIAKEFFHPTCSDAKMLTIADPHNHERKN